MRDVAAALEPGDTIVDGGNTYYRDDIRRERELAERGIRYLDCGTSGGVFGLERGFSLMVGGDAEAFAHLEPIFLSLAPGVDAAPRTPGRAGDPAPEEHGYLHCGPAGAGHFVKMVHNGIEYGLMAAFAEGLNVLAHANAGAVDRPQDAETAPLADSGVLPLRAGPARGGRGVAPRLGGRVVAARPHRRRAAAVARPRGLLGPRL